MNSDQRRYLAVVCGFCAICAVILFGMLILTAVFPGPYALVGISLLPRALGLLLCGCGATFFGNLGWNLYRGNVTTLNAPVWFPWRNDDGNPP